MDQQDVISLNVYMDQRHGQTWTVKSKAVMRKRKELLHSIKLLLFEVSMSQPQIPSVPNMILQDGYYLMQSCAWVYL